MYCMDLGSGRQVPAVWRVCGDVRLGGGVKTARGSLSSPTVAVTHFLPREVHMPANIVKPGQERYWAKAKKLAAQQGRAEDWPYVVGIFQRMTGGGGGEDEAKKSLGTSLAATPRFVLGRWPGQVPNADAMKAIHDAERMPQPATVARRLAQGGTYLSPEAVVDGLGLDTVQRKRWIGHIQAAMSSGNEVTFRRSLTVALQSEKIDPALRSAFMQRALAYYRRMQKSMVRVVTVDELRKSGALRTPEIEQLEKALVRRAERHPGGLPLSGVSDLVRRYGSASVGAAMSRACRARLEFRNGLLLKR